ncbi:VOC family protein [Longimicrobium sp.]|uniref:VOC family protein n=1 Tax=Longimicrobium sp. TaxID=2029185 RepID=UPI002BAE103D|nr:VOC family protein [Longimicrobium sp.]HSU14929.1 VOC family protein [Longimicrobium sp.]
MEPRISLVTLGVEDLARSVAFYRDGLGWPMSGASVEGTVAFFRAGGVVLALYPRPLLAADASLPDRHGAWKEFGGIALAHNVRERGEVDAALERAVSIGGRILTPAADAEWGGRSGYFADPDGHPWEVAWNPAFPFANDGTLILP